MYIRAYCIGIFDRKIERGTRSACNLRGNASGRRSKVFRARASHEDDDAQWGREREVPVFRGDVGGGPPCEMPQQRLQCGDCKNRLPDLTTDMCRLLSYKSLNGLVRERDRRRKQDGGKERKGEEEGNGKLDGKVRVLVLLSDERDERMAWNGSKRELNFIQENSLDLFCV